MRFSASFFDGHSKHSHPVEVHLDDFGQRWIIRGEHIGELSFPIDMITIEPATGQQSERILLTGGAYLEIELNDTVEGLLPGIPDSWVINSATWLKNHLYWILAVMVICIVIGGAMAVFGVDRD